MRRLAGISLAFALATAAPAAARTAPASAKIAPPGNSALSEYFETVPTAAGGRSVIPRPRRLSRLDRLGPDGRAVANILAGGGGTPARLRRHRGAASRAVIDAGQPSAQLPALRHGIGSSGLLAGLLVAGVALVLGAATAKLARRTG